MVHGIESKGIFVGPTSRGVRFFKPTDPTSMKEPLVCQALMSQFPFGPQHDAVRKLHLPRIDRVEVSWVRFIFTMYSNLGPEVT